MRDPFVHDSPVLLIVTYAEDDTHTLYLVDYGARPIFRELISCSILRLREHLVVIVVPLASSAHGRKIPTHELSGLELRLQLCPRQKVLLGKLY